MSFLLSGRRADAIPDSDVYLHDDWGDNKLQDRVDGDTTTHNGVEGVYRPEYTVDSGSPQASNERLEISGGEALRAGINLNLTETITWEIRGLEMTNFDDDQGTRNIYVNLFAESTSISVGTFPATYSNGYQVVLDAGESGSLRFLIDGSAQIEETNVGLGPHDIDVTRDPNGDWGLSVNGTSAGSINDTQFTDPLITGFSARSRQTESVIDEYKVF